VKKSFADLSTKFMAQKLRRMGRNTRSCVIFLHDDLEFLLAVADRLENQEERIAIMTDPEEATAEQLAFGGEG
jgi:hypothetical protein